MRARFEEPVGDLPGELDVVVVGAGLSGIGAGYRLQTQVPGLSFAILEMRDSLGGTWDLFRYPGVRSDSDMFTLGYEFAPWRDPKSIADGRTILDYLRDIAVKHGVDRRIHCGVKVLAADWSTADARWTLTLDVRGEHRTLRCRFLYSCAGYYDYEHPHVPDFPGVEDFAGTLVSPQFWPEHLDYAGKRVVVIGSGATAVTVVPAMASGEGDPARAAGHVTMLQRSPTWISAIPGRDKIADRLRRHLPAGLAHRLARAKNIAFSVGFYEFCQRFPERASKLLLGLSAKHLGDPALVAAHFTPSYGPWDQRLCAVPDADFFKAVRRGTADVVTDTIERFEPGGIRLASGDLLEADLVVCATGLTLKAFGGIAPSVDGVEVDLAEQFVWQGAMITGLPNFAVCIGYTNASWTLRADLTHRLVCKVLRRLESGGYDAVCPQPERDLVPRPLLDLSSGYVRRSIGDFPKQGQSGPWRVHQNYPLDATLTLGPLGRRDLTRTLAFSRVSEVAGREELEPTG